MQSDEIMTVKWQVREIGSAMSIRQGSVVMSRLGAYTSGYIQLRQ